MNKREFILAACAACTVALPAVPAAAARSIRSIGSHGANGSFGTTPDLAHGIDAATWCAWVGQAFALDRDASTHVVALSEVRESASSRRHRQFTLVFDGVDRTFSDGIHTLRHTSGQELDLFVEGLETASGRIIAQFNLLT
jgi:hypothetical protein